MSNKSIEASTPVSKPITLTASEILFWMKAVVAECKFPNFTFEASQNVRGEYFLQGRYKEPDTVTGLIEWQYTRKWVLTPEMPKSEIVQTAFKCVLTSMEHRTREWFTYRDKSIFGPHFDVDALYSICKSSENYDGRTK